MKRWGKQPILFSLFVFGLLALIAFNNCSRLSVFSVLDQSSTSSAGSSSAVPGSPANNADGGGGAYDGKVSFHRYDPDKCAERDVNKQPLPNATLQVARVSGGRLAIEKVREACQNLQVPLAIDQSEIKIIADGSIRYQKQSYIAEKPNSIAPIGYSIVSAEGAKLWGPGKCVIDGLWNGDIGNGGNVMSQRFRSPVSDSVAAIRVNWADGAAAGGTGGTVRIRVYADDGSVNHLPNTSGPVYAEAIYVPNLVAGSFSASAMEYDEVVMTSQRPLVRGEIYHMYYENLDANDSVNYIGIESQTSGPHHGRVCRFIAPEDWGLVKSSDSVASVLEDRTKELLHPAFWAPILQVRTAQGAVFGNSNIDTGNTTSMIVRVGPGAPVRERISPQVAHKLARFHIHTAAVSAGTLDWRLVHNGNSTVLASGTITEANANYRVGSVTVLPNTGFFEWYEVNVPTPVMLAPGSTYSIEFSTSDGSEWAFAGQYDGAERGFAEGAAFTQSVAEYFSAGAWVSFDNWSPSTRGESTHWRILFEDQ